MGNCCTTRDRELMTGEGGNSNGDGRRSPRNEVQKSLIFIAKYFEESKLFRC